MTDQMLPPANWYADPEGSAQWRYWDGEVWTDECRPLGSTLPTKFEKRPPGPIGRAWNRCKPVVFAVSLVGLFAVLAFQDEPSGGLFLLAIVAGQMSSPDHDGDQKLWARWAFPVALMLGILVGGHFVAAVLMAACVAVMLLLGRFEDSWPSWLWVAAQCAVLAGFVAAAVAFDAF